MAPLPAAVKRLPIAFQSCAKWKEVDNLSTSPLKIMDHADFLEHNMLAPLKDTYMNAGKSIKNRLASQNQPVNMASSFKEIFSEFAVGKLVRFTNTELCKKGHQTTNDWEFRSFVHHIHHRQFL